MATSITVRMYNQMTLGDCFLLTCTSGTKKSYVLIDFGSYTSSKAVTAREQEIAQDIVNTVGKEPLIIVLTHQHKDHLTGFISAKSILDQLHIREVWFSYLDDPTGPEAKHIRDTLERFWNKNKTLKKKIKLHFGQNHAVSQMLKAKDGFDLFAEDQVGGEAITNLMAWANGQHHFLVPGQHFALPGLPEGKIHVYVLGPPTDPDLLKKLNPSHDEEVNELHTMMQISEMTTSLKLVDDALELMSGVTPATDDLQDFPFNKRYVRYQLTDTHESAVKKYTEEDWRMIDEEWLSEAGRISLHMDSLTNNTSLVLAFYLVEEDRVALFVGDAQIGNWKSWFTIPFEDADMDATSLLSRTVFYKAGHHSSHNATLLEGLDLMDERKLVIMIPVDGAESKRRGFAMLRNGMMKGYNRKSHGRVLQADDIYHTPDGRVNFPFPFASKPSDFSPKLNVVLDAAQQTHLYIEYTVK